MASLCEAWSPRCLGMRGKLYPLAVKYFAIYIIIAKERLRFDTPPRRTVRFNIKNQNEKASTLHSERLCSRSISSISSQQSQPSWSMTRGRRSKAIKQQTEARRPTSPPSTSPILQPREPSHIQAIRARDAHYSRPHDWLTCEDRALESINSFHQEQVRPHLPL